jgi:hypothetical protein
MDDIIVYLIFIAFALLSRLLTKKKDPQKPAGSGRPEGESERPQKQVSFEDLLREFTGEGDEQRKPASAPYNTYEEEEYENYEEQNLRDEEAREVYSKSIHQAKNLKTIDELVDYDKIKTKLSDIPEPEKQKYTLADEIRNQLKNPDEIRKAVIYSEILQRKY